MRVAVEKLDGVESAEVSLNEGRVHVQLASENSVTIARLRRVIRDQGFSPRDATLTLTARIEIRGGGLVAIVPGSGVTYTVTAGGEVRPRLSEAAGGTVVLEGEVAMDEDDVTPERIEVTRVGQDRP